MACSVRLPGLLVFAFLAVPPAASQDRSERLKIVPASIRFLDHPVQLPLLQGSPLPVVQIAIGRLRPLNMVLDTGASGLILFRPVVERLGLPTRRISINVGVGVGPALRGVEAARIQALGLLDGTETRAVIHALDALVVEGGPAVPGVTTHGVVGIGVFAPVLLTLDLSARLVEIAAGELGEPDGRTILPLRTTDLSVALPCGREEIRFLIDSGFDGAVLLPEIVARRLAFQAEPVVSGGVVTAGLSASRSSGRLVEDIHLGRYTLVQPVVDIVPGVMAPVLGVEVLDHFRVTLDQLGGRVRFLGDGDPRISAPSLRTWGFRTRIQNGSCVVVSVDPASPAHEAGLRAGDDILEARGLLACSLTPAVWDRLREDVARTSLSLLVGRDDVVFRVSVPLHVLVR